MAKKVLYLKTHQTIFVPGLGDLGSTLPPIAKTVPALDMEIEGEHVLIRGKSKSGLVSALLPLANVVVLTYIDEADKAPKAAKEGK